MLDNPNLDSYVAIAETSNVQNMVGSNSLKIYNGSAYQLCSSKILINRKTVIRYPLPVILYIPSEARSIASQDLTPASWKKNLVS